MRLILDFVPNHSSDQHVWFRESKKSNHSSNSYRNYYVWRDPKPGCRRPPETNDETCLPNNWVGYMKIWTLVKKKSFSFEAQNQFPDTLSAQMIRYDLFSNHFRYI